MAHGSSSLDSEPSREGRQVFSQFLCFGPWGIQLMFWAIKKEMVGLLSLTTLSLWFKYFSPVNVLGYFWTIFSPIKGTKLKTALALCFSEVIFWKVLWDCSSLQKASEVHLKCHLFCNLPWNPTPFILSSEAFSLTKPFLTTPVDSRWGQYTSTASVIITCHHLIPFHSWKPIRHAPHSGQRIFFKYKSDRIPAQLNSSLAFLWSCNKI